MSTADVLSCMYIMCYRLHGKMVDGILTVCSGVLSVKDYVLLGILRVGERGTHL